MTAVLLAMALALTAASEPVSSAGETVPESLSGSFLKSESQRFTILATNDAQAILLGRWAEEVTDRVERLAGQPVPVARGGIRIVAREPGAGPAGRIALQGQVIRGTAVQSLIFFGHAQVDAEAAHEALCRLLLNACVVNRWTAGGFVAEVPADAAFPNLPFWLVRGVAQNLYGAQRERNSAECRELWAAGRLPSAAVIPGVLTPEQAAALPRDRSVLGLFVRWLASGRDDAAGLGRILDRLAAGEPVTAAWLAASLSPGAAPAALDEAWDAWILAERHTVYRPGRATPQAVTELRGLLLLYPGSSGMPLSGGSGRPVDFGYLIGARDQDWVPAMARNRASRLRLLAVGRGDEFMAVAEAYARFLDALTQRRPRRELVRLLAAAEAALGALETGIAQDAAAGGRNDEWEE